jgi:hypothetical protein
MRLRPALVVIFVGCTACGPIEEPLSVPNAGDQPHDRDTHASVEMLLRDLPLVAPEDAAKLVEGRARRLGASCERLQVSRVAAIVRIDAGVGCAALRGRAAIGFHTRRGGVEMHARFERWSIGDADVLDGEWVSPLELVDAVGIEEETPFADEQQAVVLDIGTTTIVDAQGVTRRCLDEIAGTEASLLGALAELPQAAMLAAPLMVFAGLERATRCR